MSPRSIARLAGLLYVIVAVSGGFAQLVARGGIRVPGDVTATADNIRANATILQLGFVADAINVVAFVLVALLLYGILAPARPGLSRAFVALAAIAGAIMASDLANHVAAMMAATTPSLTASIGADAADALAALFLDVHAYGYLAAEVFFGAWLIPLGAAIYLSGAMPRWLGVAAAIGGAAYLVSFAITAASPGFAASPAALVAAMPAAIAELALMLWLLVRGAELPTDHVGATSSVQATAVAQAAS